MLHTVYKGPEGETTQWEDIQRKMGNLPPKEPVWKAEKFAPQQAAKKDEQWLDKKEADELEELEDEFADDPFLEQYRWVIGYNPIRVQICLLRLKFSLPRCCCCRLKRIQEMEQAASRPRFGTMDFIRGSEFVQKVTNAGTDVWVVVLLYKDSHEGCSILSACFEELAVKHPNSKFVKIISTDCIPNYPDQNLPTVLIYHNGSCQQHLVGLANWGGKRTTPEQVAIYLSKYGSICGDPVDEAHGERQVRSLVQRMIAQKEQQRDEGDESSDFDDL